MWKMEHSYLVKKNVHLFTGNTIYAEEYAKDYPPIFIYFFPLYMRSIHFAMRLRCVYDLSIVVTLILTNQF